MRILVTGATGGTGLQGIRQAATVYASPVEAVQADDVQEVPGYQGMSWHVDAWHVTLHDGAVSNVRTGDDDHAEELAGFVQRHLLP